MKKKKLVPQAVYCPYCGRKAEFVDSSVIYHGRSYGMVYLCRCKPELCYVGVHKGTAKPLGRLADAKLRYWKNRAHEAFDPLWKYGRFKNCRNVAYAWLADQMRLPVQETHIGMFDVTQCKQVIAICNQERRYRNAL